MKKTIISLILLIGGIANLNAQTIYNYSYDSKGNLKTRFIQVLKTAVEETEALSESEEIFMIYPNPVINELTIDLTAVKSDKSGIIQIYNSLGQKIQSITYNEIKTKVNFSLYSKGIYYIEVIIDDKKWVKELVKMNQKKVLGL